MEEIEQRSKSRVIDKELEKERRARRKQVTKNAFIQIQNFPNLNFDSIHNHDLQ